MASTDATEKPYYGLAFRATFPLLDADGDLVSGASGLDSEISKDAGTFSDCSNEATEIATSSGMYYLDLTSTEMEAETVSIIVKSSSAKTTPLVFYTSHDVVERGTATGGGATSIAFRASPRLTGDDVYNGMKVRIVGGTGEGQERIITDYVDSTDTATVGSAWETNPDTTSIYEVWQDDLSVQSFPTNFEDMAIEASTGYVSSNVVEISDDSGAADNMESFFDGTGYSGTGNTIPTVTNVTNRVTANTDQIEGSDATNQINAACDSAIETYGLDHLVSASVTGSDIADDSIIAQMVSDSATADWDSFSNTTGSLEAIAADTARIETDTQDIQNRLPSSLTSGRMNTNVQAVNGNTTAASIMALIYGNGASGTVSTANTAATTTSFATASLTDTDDDTYIGKEVMFTSGANDTERQTVSDSSWDAGSSETILSFDAAFTAAPANGVSFVII